MQEDLYVIGAKSERWEYLIIWSLQKYTIKMGVSSAE